MGVTEYCKLLTTAGAVSRKRVANTGFLNLAPLRQQLQSVYKF